MRRSFVLAGNRITGKVSVREFVDRGSDSNDYEEALDAACEDVGWDHVSWGIYRGCDTESAFKIEFKSHLENLLEAEVEVTKLNPNDPLWSE